MDSDVEAVTVKARRPCDAFSFITCSDDALRIYISPEDHHSGTQGHQVSLSYGTNIILVSVHATGSDVLATHVVEITRAGNSEELLTNSVSIADPVGTARGGSTLPFLLSRTGSTTQSLTVSVQVSEGKGDMIPSSSEGRVEVQFQEGYASARLDLATFANPLDRGSSSSWVRVQVLPGPDYQVHSRANRGSWYAWDKDFRSLSLQLILVDDNGGTRIDIGDFDPLKRTYSAEVESTVEYVTIAHTAYPHGYSKSIETVPSDARPTVAGHQVDLNHGKNLIVVAVFDKFEPDVNVYRMEINRAGTAREGSSITIAAYGLPEESFAHTEGHRLPFVLTRTGDVSEVLTVQVNVSETGGDMVSDSSEGSTEVGFLAGYASAELEVVTNFDDEWEEHSTVTVEVEDGVSYSVSTTANSTSTYVMDDDIPEMTAVLTVDSTRATEGDEITATVTVTTHGPQKPSRNAGVIAVKAVSGTAGTDDFELLGINNGWFNLHGFEPLVSGGVTKAYQARYVSPISITDDERAEPDETFMVIMEGIRLADNVTLDPANTFYTVTISGEDETPGQPDPISHATVEVADWGSTGSTFTVSWNDLEECTSTYRASLWWEGQNQSLGMEIGSTGPQSSQLTGTQDDTDLGGLYDSFKVVVGCPGRQGRPIVGVPLPSIAGGSVERPKPGTYSSERPLTGLTVSSGTLSPAFSKDGFLYAVLDVPLEDEQITVAATAKSDYSISWDPPIDADPDADGHQVDLEIGYNTIYVQVGRAGVNSFDYEIIVKRAESSQRQFVNSPAAGQPAINGTAQVGQALTADTSSISDLDGLNNGGFSYQWMADDADIPRATGSTYTLVEAELGKAVKVRVNFTDGAGNEESLTSAPTAAVSAALPPPPENVRAVTQKSGAVALTWESPDGATVTGYRIERRRAGEDRSDQQRSAGSPRDNHTLVEDTGSADTSYTDHSAEKGVEYEYRVSARNEAGPGEGSDWVRAGQASASNTPATGAPTIRGTTQVGQTLTADITGISDTDGLSGETFTYQWVSSDGTTDTDIENATASTYKLVDADQGKAIKVRVTFTDDGGNEETLTSAPTAPVLGDGPPGAPRNLTATPGNKEVTLSWEPPADNGNPPATRYRIEWRVDGKDYDKNHWGTARSASYTTNDQANLANGVKYFFRVKAENGSGNGYGPYGPASEEVSATPTSGSAVDLGTPVLSDTETLHHGMVRLDWQDVEDAGWYVVQHYHLEGGEWLDLPAEGVDIAFHGSSAVVSNLHGLSWLRVGAASCDGASEWSQIEELYGTNASDWEGVPVPEVEEGDEIEPCPVVLGTPVLSDTEYLHHGMVQLDWQDIEDAGWYVVQHYHLEGGEWLDLPAEGVDIAFHGSSAVVSNLHGLSWLRVGAASCDGESEWSQIEQLFGTNASDWEGVPVPEVAEGDEIEPCSEDADTPDNSPATGAPTISGTVQVGETLTADTSDIADADGLANATFSYQWITDDSVIVASAARTYTPTDGDRGKSVKVRVSFTDDAGNPETRTSANTATVEARANSPATGLPSISGTAQVGQTLTANTSGITDVDGMENATFTYQWLADDTDISGATNASYTLAAEDEGKAIKVQVSFTDNADNEETLTSAATDAVAAAAAPPPDNVRAVAKKSGAVELTWDAPQDATVTGYRIERRPTGGNHSDQGRSAGSPRDYHTLVEDTGSTDTVYTDNTAERGVGYEYRVSARNEAGAGAESDWVNAEEVTAPNSPATGLPSISGTAQVGETLTANTSGIADADGLGSVQYEYQWLADDTDIAGATGSTYTLAAADEGKTIKVKVSFTDDADNEETLTSVATAAVAGAVDSGAPSYITVEVTEDYSDPINIVTNFAITWNDAAVCSVDYNAYLNIKPTYLTDDETEESQLHLGSAASDGAQITAGLTGVQGGTRGFDVELYCGTDGSGRLLSRVDIPWGPIHPKPGTYSSEPPLSALSVSHGTMTPTFQGGTSFYTVPDIANAETRITITATPKEGYHVKFFEGSDSFVFGFIVQSVGPDAPSGLSDECGGSYSDFFGQLYERTDADPDTPGFQMDLFDGKNYVWVRVYPNAVCTLGKGYLLMITRAEGEISLPRPNTPASYTPTISGRVGVWLTLTADTLQVRDRDGLTNATFNYQWLADDAEISGATGSSYTVAAADQGKSLKVQVSFTDDRGGNEIVTSEAVVVPSGVPRITGTTEVGQTLHADVSGIGDPNGWDESTFSYQWLADDAEITGATDFSYLVADTDLGKTLKVRVSFTDGRGNEETLTSHATRVVRLRNFLPTGKPVILGTAEVGQTLRVDVSGISDPNGMTNAAFTYQWMNTGWTDSNEYTLEDRDEGRRIWLQAAYTDDAGHRHVLESPATDAVAARPSSPATGAPTISGTAQVGETLTVDTSGIADENGLENVAFTYQWLADDADIAGATGSTYTLVAEDEGKAIKVQVSFTDDADNEETLTSGATDTVEAAPTTNSPATGAPTISGTAQVGETLTANTSGVADVDGLSNVQYEYQWLADDSDISGATNATYTLTDSEESKAITVQVSFTDDAGNEESLTSGATDTVAGAQSTEPPAKPRNLSATATHDSVTLTWDDPGDDSITGYVILRRVPGVDPEGHFNVLVADTGTAATTYTDDTVSAETRYTYRIKAINGAGTSERSRWSHIDVPAAPVPDKPTGLEATESHGQVTLTWDDPGDDSITGYVILRRVRENNTGGDAYWSRTRAAPPPPTPTTRWRPTPPTPTASRPSTSTGPVSVPAGST